MMKSAINDNRAVSDALGFALIFAIVISSVGVIYAAGVDNVEQIRQQEQFDNAERGMYIAQQNIRDIYIRGVPGRGVEFRLTDSRLSIGSSSRATVRIDGTEVYSRDSRVFEYRVSDERAIAYAWGGLIRTTPSGATMSRDPALAFRNNRAFISMVELRGNDTTGGTQTVLTVFRNEGSDFIVQKDSNPTVTIKINTTPERAQAWNRYFKKEGLTQVTYNPSNGVVVYETTVDEVIVRKSVVSSRFE